MRVIDGSIRLTHAQASQSMPSKRRVGRNGLEEENEYWEHMAVYTCPECGLFFWTLHPGISRSDVTRYTQPYYCMNHPDVKCGTKVLYINKIAPPAPVPVIKVKNQELILHGWD